MALGYLALLVIGMGILALVGTILLFVVKSKRASDVIMVLMTFYALVIAYLSATAQPTNFVAQQVVCWVIGMIAVVGTGARFFKKEQSLLSKSLVTASVIGGFVYMFFF